jgi:hypothetical protein
MALSKSFFRQECITNGLNLDGWKVYYFHSKNENDNIEWGRFYIIKKSLTDDEDLPSLVAMAGFSVKSFCGTTNKIIQNLDKIESKYKDVWVLCFTEQVKGMQSKACQERDATNLYDPEIKLNEKIGKFVNKLLNVTGLTNIHLLGKCAGGGVAIHTFTQDIHKYNALYLGVPASPQDVQHLLKNKWTDKKFIFAWDVRDAYKFNWGLSNQEIERYQKTMAKLEGNGNTIILREFGEGEPHEKNFHEVPDELFDLL